MTLASTVCVFVFGLLVGLLLSLDGAATQAAAALALRPGSAARVVGAAAGEGARASPCPVLPSPRAPSLARTFWTSDLHDGTRADVTSTLTALGHSLVLAGHKGQKGPYRTVFAHPRVQQPLARLADYLQGAKSSMSRLTEKDIAAVFAYYQHDPQVAATDAFVCMFPNAACELWMPYNKSIIWLAAHRYVLGRCATAAWVRLGDHMRATLARRGSGSVVAAMSRYDVEYINYYTGLRPLLVSSSSLWYAGRGATTWRARPRPEILIGPLQRRSWSHTRNMSHATDDEFQFVAVKVAYPRFELQDIANHRAIVIFPYAVMSYGITECYAMGIPIFVPSIDFLYALGLHGMRDYKGMHDYQVTVHTSYCGPGAVPPPRHPDANPQHVYSPEHGKDFASFEYWMQFADLFTWPHITQFSSYADLAAKLKAANFSAIHEAMLMENTRRERELSATWNSIAAAIPRKTSVPNGTYVDAIRALWGVDRLMVS